MFLLCEGCGFVVTQDHKLVSYIKNAPTSARLKEFCPE